MGTLRLLILSPPALSAICMEAPLTYRHLCPSKSHHGLVNQGDSSILSAPNPVGHHGFLCLSPRDGSSLRWTIHIVSYLRL